ncbi:MAG: hypothetical protein IJA72_00560 [Clostridia bacterium]|nr:hypothetical protein [Clostridia bacterium]
MNKIGINQCKDILDSFAWDSTGYEESSGIRAREREDSHIFYFRDWFNIVTERGLREGRYFDQNTNSFSRKRNAFNEHGNVSLCALSWKGGAGGKCDRCEYFDRMRKEWEGKRLIAKEVKKCTNYGKEYNQNSLYDTVEDCLANGEDLVIEPSKQAQADAVVNYLKYLNLEQRIIAFHIQELELNKEENALQDEISSIKQQLTLLQEKHCAKQQERSNLQQKQNELQQEQDNLLR